MTKEDRGSESPHATGGVMWLAVVVAAVVLMRPLLPWEGSRPSESDSRARVAAQAIDARLWQDPFGAIRRAYAGRDGSLNPPPPPCVAHEAVEEALAGNGTLLMGVMVAGGPYPADTEARRRARYAVLAALNTMGFVPHDSEHVGVFSLGSGRQARGNRGTGNDEAGKRNAERDLVAYEWFRPAESGGFGSVRPGRQRVLVLWLGDAFKKDTAAQVEELRSLLSSQRSCPRFGESPPSADTGSSPKDPSRGMPPEFVVLGPLFSGDLRTMIDRIDPARPSAAPGATAIESTFYAYGVTADDSFLLPDERAGSQPGPGRLSWPIQATSPHGQIRILRSITTDGRVAEALARELQARGVDPAGVQSRSGKAPAQRSGMPRPGRRNDVVLVSEWDTLDSRALTRTVTRHLKGRSPDASDVFPSVHAFSYLRGLDGQLPEPEDKDHEDSAGEDGTGKSPKRGRIDSDRDIERPDGQSQYDYLRRLSARLHGLQRSLQESGRGIGAIGVLGSDVYDKLLILQALRSQFPGVIFFTTDLDARLLHPRERDWTRNLVVASGFGLELHPSLQQGIAPFRDSYQTSLYLSALSALAGLHRTDASTCGSSADSSSGQPPGCPLARALFGQAPHPARIYEVGRTRAFDLSENPSSRDEMPAECALPQALGRCSLVHPFRPELYPRPRAGSLSVAVGLALAALLAWALARGWIHRLLPASAGEPGESTARRPESADRQPRAAVPVFSWVVLAAVVVLAVAAVSFADRLWIGLAGYLTEGGRGEPVALFEGISVWPTMLLRLVSIGLSIGLLIHGWIRLESNLETISRRLELQRSREALKAKLSESPRHGLSGFLRIFSFRLVEVRERPVDPTSDLTPKAEEFWIKYLLQNRPISRFVRIATVTLLYWFAAGAVIRVVSGRPTAPLRGAVSQLWQYPITLISVLSMLFLIFFVVDATLFCYQFVRELRRKYAGSSAAEAATGRPSGSRWPQGALDHHVEKLNLDERHVDHWLNMRFVAMRTKAVSQLIYYPYIVISLMFVSRSTIFDRWGAPLVIDVLNGISVLIVTVCAILLRSGAERLRRKSIWRLTNDMIALRGASDPQRQKADQIELLIEQIRTFREGAFAPYSQQPLLRALLLPLGGLGGTAALELMSAADL